MSRIMSINPQWLDEPGWRTQAGKECDVKKIPITVEVSKDPIKPFCTRFMRLAKT